MTTVPPVLPPLLAPGARGDAVRDLKARLGRVGHPPGGSDAADEFGPSTEAAVRAFQTARGLRVDGVCGPETLAALVESAYALGDRLLCERQPMLRGDDVAELQRTLSALGFDAGKEDGIFGPRTAGAVEDFQRNAGVTVDGVCGPETLAALERLGSGRLGDENGVGSVAHVRERDALLRAPKSLAGRRLYLAVEPGLEAIGEVVRDGLLEGTADVVLEPAADDQSKVAVEANAWDADLVVMLRPGGEPGFACAFYETASFRSERGHRTATCVVEEVGRAMAEPAGRLAGKTYAVLRETRAPAVVCELAPGASDAADAIGAAIVRGIRRAVEEPLEGSASQG